MLNSRKNPHHIDIYDIPQDKMIEFYPSVYELVIDATIRSRHLFKDIYRMDDFEEPFLMKKTDPIEKPTVKVLQQIYETINVREDD